MIKVYYISLFVDLDDHNIRSVLVYKGTNEKQ